MASWYESTNDKILGKIDLAQCDDYENDGTNRLPKSANVTPKITFSMIKDPTPAQILEECNRLESVRESVIYHLELNRK